MNGAGPRGFGWLVPDQIGLVNISKAANIHDCHYYFISRHLVGIDESAYLCIVAPDFLHAIRFGDPREYADRIFLKNLNILNKKLSPTKMGYYLRKPIIYSYYLAVRGFGDRFL
jgi:hypothetical protein